MLHPLLHRSPPHIAGKVMPVFLPYQYQTESSHTHTHTHDIAYGDRCNSPQQNTGKQNLTIYKKDCITWDLWRYAKLVHYMKVNQQLCHFKTIKQITHA